MQLHDLKPPRNSRFSRKRLGCGVGSGLGKTSGRGHKGQNSRSGGGVRPGFEGGQTPLYRRLPRRGFSNARYTTIYEVVNVGDVAKFKKGTEVTAEILAQAGLMRASRGSKLKILGTGEISVALTVKADKFSKSAASKIIAAGGTCEMINNGSPVEVKPVEKKEVKKTAKKVAEKPVEKKEEVKKTAKKTEKQADKKETKKESEKSEEK